MESGADHAGDLDRLGRLMALLQSRAGDDRYVIHVMGDQHYQLEFPNATTRYGPDLESDIYGLLGRSALRVE